MITKEDINNFDRDALIDILRGKKKEIRSFFEYRDKSLLEIRKKVDVYQEETVKQLWDVLNNTDSWNMQEKNINQLRYFLFPPKTKGSFFKKIEYARNYSLVDYAAMFLQVKTDKSTFLLCYTPFHQEKTPSFRINKEKNLWFCFATSQGGDLIKLVQKMHMLSFKEAVILINNLASPLDRLNPIE